MKEEWKDIDGYNGDYQISNHGRIMSFKHKKEGKIRNLGNNTIGYPQVDLWKKNRPTHFLVHRLVGFYFLGIPDPTSRECFEIDHKDKDRENCRADNLEWVTHKENCERRDSVA